MGKLKWRITLAGFYVLAFSVNFFPSLKYPDAELSFSGFLASGLFLLALLLFTGRTIRREGSPGRLKWLFLTGAAAGIAAYAYTLGENAIVGYVVPDILAGVHFPFYVVFVTPLFGLNALLNIPYGELSLVVSCIYTLLFLVIILKRQSKAAVPN